MSKSFEIGQRVTWKCGGYDFFGRVNAMSTSSIEIARAGDLYLVERRKVRAA